MLVRETVSETCLDIKQDKSTLAIEDQKHWII